MLQNMQEGGDGSDAGENAYAGEGADLRGFAGICVLFD